MKIAVKHQIFTLAFKFGHVFREASTFENKSFLGSNQKNLIWFLLDAFSISREFFGTVLLLAQLGKKSILSFHGSIFLF